MEDTDMRHRKQSEHRLWNNESCLDLKQVTEAERQRAKRLLSLKREAVLKQSTDMTWVTLHRASPVVLRA